MPTGQHCLEVAAALLKCASIGIIIPTDTSGIGSGAIGGIGSGAIGDIGSGAPLRLLPIPADT
jgi:hypothetical protein